LERRLSKKIRREKRMKILRKQVLAVTTLILMMSLALVVVAQPVNADETARIYMFISAASPVGVNQGVTVVFWMSSVTPDAMLGGGSRWTNVYVNIVNPEGQNETRGPFTMDAVASNYFHYIPTETGNYTFQAYFTGQTIPPYMTMFGVMVSYNTTFLPAMSPAFTMVVTEEPAPTPHDVPLPESYWTRPINGQNANWWSISSNWLMPGWDTMNRQFDQGSAYDPYTTAPNSAHILWTKPLTFGGIAGGEFGGTSFYNGMSYEQFFKPPVIIGGRLYYNTIVGNEPTSTSTSVNSYTTVHYENFSSITCVDMDTGATLFTIPNASLAFGQIYDFISPNQGGALAYLWDIHGPDGTWKMYDAWTGQYMLSLSGVPSGTILLDNTFGGSGDILVYSLDPGTGELSLWNSSRVLNPVNPFQNYWTWRPEQFLGQTLNATGTTIMNIPGFPIPTFDTNGTMWKVNLSNFPVGATIQQIGYDNTIWVMAGTGYSGAVFSTPLIQTWASYNMQNGNLMSAPVTIDTTQKMPANASSYYGVSEPLIISSDGILPLFVKETLSYYAWNLKTGDFAWGPTPVSTNGWAMYNWESQFVVNGILYNWGFDGMVHAFNVTTGARLWDFYTGDAGSITPYGTWPLYQGIVIADGKLFAQTGDHGNGVQPLYQGEGIYAMNATTGTPIWNLTGWFLQPSIADGKLLTQNEYDNQIYCFGRGPSATTVTAPMVAVTEGTSALIQGTVTDQSPGAKGTAAISDADMSVWMEYLYEQQSLSGHTVTGVPVSIDAVDPNNNFIHIGDAVSDGAGQFAFKWDVPKVPGMYNIVVTFAGSNSYWPSHAETSMIVSQAAASPTPTTVTTAESPFGMYTLVAAIILIILVAAAIVLLLRRR
jgi:hypothetical protein